MPSHQIGHQVGEALAKEGRSWVNLNFVTLEALAQEIAGKYHSRIKIMSMDGFLKNAKIY